MVSISSGDELIEYLSLHKRRAHWLLHLHMLPILSAHAVWLLVYSYYSGQTSSSPLFTTELLMLVTVALALLQLLMWLASQWSVHIQAFITCTRTSNLDDADVVKVVPTENNGASEMVKLHKDRKKESDEKDVQCWFEFQRLKYVYDSNKKCFAALDFPVDLSVNDYLEAKGHEDEFQHAQVLSRHGNNKLDMSLPTFNDLFVERATAPFFVFQVFCVGLWCLDEYWYYSLFTLLMLVVFECTLVKQQMRNMAEIRKMGNAPTQILVYRQRKWRYMSSDQLVVNDIVSVVNSERKVNESMSTSDTNNDNSSKNDSGLIVPCDLVLVRGQCIVDESMLTGESVPQMKEGIEVITERETYFDEESMGKLHMLYAGTKVVQCTPGAVAKGNSNSAGVSKPGNNGCVGYVVRTGFHTSQGKLLRTILFGVRRITANNVETFLFITFLLMFAIAAAAYVWIKGTEDPSRNRYKLFLECTLILTSVVPPELPIELSLAVNTSLLSLTKLSIFCTEPFRIPFGGKVEICCFDKTGTLTSDHLVIDGIAGVNRNSNSEISKHEGESKESERKLKKRSTESEPKFSVAKIEETPIESIRVLATCHSLVQLDDGLIGDPLEKATLKAIDWNLTKGEVVIPRRNTKQSPIKIVHRHHFTSSLKRMTVIASYTDDSYSSKQKHLVTVKGAPETLRSMYKQLPDDYDQVYLYHARRGARVLALGYKELGEEGNEQESLHDSKSSTRMRDLSRDYLEQDLLFAGFVVISCPLKSDSKKIVQEILDGCHRIVMITGDNALTAIHVGRELGFVDDFKKHTLMLKEKNNDNNMLNSKKWVWENVDSSLVLDFDGNNFQKDNITLFSENELCLTGDALTFLRENHPVYLSHLLPRVKVFARVSPKQKERVVTDLNGLGFATLMCGDGTNDVAALKHSSVGVAILSSAPPSQKAQRRKKPESTAGSTSSGSTIDPKTKKRLVSRQEATRRTAPKPSNANEQLQKMLKEMEEMEKASIVKLGDASIAAPFTAKHSSIEAVTHIIKQGRCTLVTTLQMFKILALNALILAYSQSVLYLEGVKFSDGQATLQGLLLATCFLFISRSKPLQRLSKTRPLPNIFNVYTMATVILQFAVHFSCLVFLVQRARESEPRTEEFPDLEKEFEPNLLNSTVYMISMTLQLATFAINYRGHPYMESLMEHRPLLYCLLATGGFIVALASGLMPELSEQFAIVDFEPDYRAMLLQVLAADFVVSLVLDRICLKLFGEGRLKELP